MHVLLVTPPTVQLNTPYPATAYLSRFLKGQGIAVSQRDLGLELMLQLFSGAGLTAVFAQAEEAEALPEEAWGILGDQDRHIAVIDGVVSFLQGTNASLVHRLARPGFLPSTPRLQGTPRRYGPRNLDDHAHLVASLYLADLADFVTATLDPGFGLIRYQHHLATGPVSFDPIAARLEQTTLLDDWLDQLTDSLLEDGPVDLVGISLPFPGTLVAGLRIGKRLKQRGVPVVMGGGYVNTELRETDEPRLWDSTDALLFDDGEGPLLAWLEWAAGGPDRRHRTRTREGWHQHPVPRPEVVNVADYGDLPLHHYLRVRDTDNPARRTFSDSRWNKATLAHGCYWKRCAFCDVNLDYVARYAPSPIPPLVEAMVEVAEETGETGFHLVDEAAPPRLLKELALAVLQKDLPFTFWGNVRFERAFTDDLCRLLSRAGLTLVTGGLEVASDRLLTLMDKGITVAQAAKACQAFTRAGIQVHAYLMFGFPTQTLQEVVDSAEVVRQLFANGVLESAFWHRFVLTRHSRVYENPGRYRVSYQHPVDAFALNDLDHDDPTGTDFDVVDEPLARSLVAWMAGEQRDRPVHHWFDEAPPTTLAPDYIARLLAAEVESAPNDAQRLVWTGGGWLEGDGFWRVFGPEGAVDLTATDPAALAWLGEIASRADPHADEPLTVGAARALGPHLWPTWWPRLHGLGLVAV